MSTTGRAFEILQKREPVVQESSEVVSVVDSVPTPASDSPAAPSTPPPPPPIQPTTDKPVVPLESLPDADIIALADSKQVPREPYDRTAVISALASSGVTHVYI